MRMNCQFSGSFWFVYWLHNCSVRHPALFHGHPLGNSTLASLPCLLRVLRLSGPLWKGMVLQTVEQLWGWWTNQDEQPISNWAHWLTMSFYSSISIYITIISIQKPPYWHRAFQAFQHCPRTCICFRWSYGLFGKGEKRLSMKKISWLEMGDLSSFTTVNCTGTGGQPDYLPPPEPASPLTALCVACVASIIVGVPVMAVALLLQPHFLACWATPRLSGKTCHPAPCQNSLVSREVGLWQPGYCRNWCANDDTSHECHMPCGKWASGFWGVDSR